MRKVIVGLAVVAAMGLVTQTAAAQTTASVRPLRFGGEVNWATDTDFGVGGRVVYAALGEKVGLSGLEGILSMDVFFPGNSVTLFDLNANVAYPLRLAGMPKLSPYVGGGLNIAHSSYTGGSATHVGLDVLAGSRFALGALTAFGEGKIELHSGSQFVLTFGVLF
jgi:hypothetical protein